MPFGMGNKRVEGFVYIYITEDELKYTYKIKNIVKLCDDEPILTMTILNLLVFLRKKYLCKYIDAVRLMIPAGIMKGATNKKKKVICIKQIILNKFRN